MHTARQLDSSLFDVTRDSVRVDRGDILPNWDRHDRLGVVMTEPFGALGASHLVQLAITAFYDAVPARREGTLRGEDPRAIYPEIYLFHVGGAFGDHSAFDFWPARKEVFLPCDARAVLDAINDRAITRLAVPDGRPRLVEHEWKEPASAHDRIRSVVAYSPTGRVAEPTWTVTGLTPATESNVQRVLTPQKRYAVAATTTEADAGPVSDTDLVRRSWARRTELRRGESESGLTLAVERRHRLRNQGGTVMETYRASSVNEALFLLV